jgi:hypothetical protein
MKRLLTVVDKCGTKISPYGDGNALGKIATALEIESHKAT